MSYIEDIDQLVLVSYLIDIREWLYDSFYIL